MMGLGLLLPIEKTASGGAAPTPSAPVNTVAPVITGTPIVPNILSCGTGTWTGYPAPTFTYQWQRDGGDIGGATSSMYTLVVADATHNIRCVVTGTNGSGNSSANSNTLGPVTKTTLSYTPVTTGTEGVAYTGATPSTTGGTAPYSYSISAGTLPTGLALDAGTGIISGIPTVPGAYSGIVLRVTDANSITDDSSPFTITIDPASAGVRQSYPWLMFTDDGTAPPPPSIGYFYYLGY